jgi:hypothetical protein
LKFFDDEKRYGINVTDLNDHYPRAVNQYTENNNLDDAVLGRPSEQPKESMISEEKEFMKPNNDDEPEAGGATATLDEEPIEIETEQQEQPDQDLSPEFMNQHDYESDDDLSCNDDNVNEVDEIEMPTTETMKSIRCGVRLRICIPTDRLNMRAFVAETPNFSWIP